MNALQRFALALILPIILMLAGCDNNFAPVFGSEVID